MLWFITTPNRGAAGCRTGEVVIWDFHTRGIAAVWRTGHTCAQLFACKPVCMHDAHAHQSACEHRP